VWGPYLGLVRNKKKSMNDEFFLESKEGKTSLKDTKKEGGGGRKGKMRVNSNPRKAGKVVKGTNVWQKTSYTRKRLPNSDRRAKA